jgi:predicted lipid-binding transport protein (Tim44 family)
MTFRLKPWLALAAVATLLTFAVTDADARSRSSTGSRGSRTYTAPPATNTAPNTARPIERSITQPGTPTRTAAAPQAAPAAGGWLNRPGLLGGLAAGFLGAGLFGLLMGNGFAGALGGIASFLGLLLQVGLIAGVVFLAWRWWQGRQQPQTASGPALRDLGTDERPRMGLGSLGGLGSGLGAAPMGAPQPQAGTDIELSKDDFDAFERLLGEVQTAYGREDLVALRSRVTPEMLSYFSEELNENATRGVVNEISDVKLLQGDLAEAWSEGEREYASVAMRYAITDRYIDRATSKVVEGEQPQEVTEVWTFMRMRGGSWLLSAIQQTS